MIKLSIRGFISAVILPCVMVAIGSFILSRLVKELLPDSLLGVLLVCFISAVIVALLAYLIGLTKGERSFIQLKLYQVYNKLTRKR
jgi:uncharacterized membrane protein YeaQ/YmgE (transglycosylase-associated protein family)